MSRLDDELRNAFRREPPPADFTERLLARVAQQPAPQPRWWQEACDASRTPEASLGGDRSNRVLIVGDRRGPIQQTASSRGQR